ncbi:SPW repeat domain-containing protein [Hymenobacter sp. B1770]|uniref:SPW repeat domain-containing protein n=1 Tax=Hymenobacter sp. B1770 TaxID=1718788 RepID=UPI003CF52050
MKVISPALHGILDYTMSGVFLALPSVFAYTGPMAWVCYALAAGYLVVSLLTNMPFGLFKLIPFPIHGGFELVSGFVFIASPWLFDFSQDSTARNLFIGLGVVFLVVYLLTDWRPQEKRDTELELG